MDSIFGVKGKGFCILASDMSAVRSILVYKHDEEKIKILDDSKMVVGAGPSCDTNAFSEYVQKNMKLYSLSNDLELNTEATAHFIRKELAIALRKAPYQANLLLAGYDQDTGPSLYWMDYMASFAKVNFGAHGYASNFIISVFDREYKYDMSVEEAMEVVKKCLHELKTRFLIHQPNFSIKIVDKDGIRSIEL